MHIHSRNKIKIQDTQIIGEGGEDKQVIIPHTRARME